MSISDLLLQWINTYSCHLTCLTLPSGNCFRIEITHLKDIYIWDFKRCTWIILHKRFTYLYSQQQWVRRFGPHTFINTACNHICIWNIYIYSIIYINVKGEKWFSSVLKIFLSRSCYCRGQGQAAPICATLTWLCWDENKQSPKDTHTKTNLWPSS